jgi:DinB superfamily
MRRTVALTALCLAMGLGVAAARRAPQGPPPTPKVITVASTLDTNISIVERGFVSAAEAMPADKYSFAPTNGEFKGVRTFAQQVKHVAAENMVLYGAILGQAPAGGVSDAETNGPASIATKEQIVQYLKDSFALGHRAVATITAENELTPLAHPPVPFLVTPLALAIFAPAHAFDHYGQVVEYLRMNGIVPPASQGGPPANPATAK